MLIDEIIKRLRSGAPSGGPFTLAGDRVFGALSPADAVAKFEAARPLLVVAPLDESAPQPKTDAPLDEQEIVRRFQIVAVFDRPASDIEGQTVASDAEAIRDQIFAAFLDWRPACSLSFGWYAGMSVIGDMPGRSAVAFTFGWLETYDHDKLRESMYDADETMGQVKTIRGSMKGVPITIVPGRPACKDED